MKAASAVTLGYLTLCGGTALAFLTARGGRGTPSMLEVLACLAPVASYSLVLVLGERDRRQAVAKMVACFLFLPVLLVMWIGARTHEALPGEPSSVAAPLKPGLDAEQLMAGAIATQQVPLAGTNITLLKSAAFADGSELRLTRFTTVDGAARQLAMLGETQGGKPFALGGRRGVALTATGAPVAWLVYVEQHGHELVEVRAESESLVRARLQAQHVPVPRAPVQGQGQGQGSTVVARERSPEWPFGVAFALVHTLSFCAFILWAGPKTTRVVAENMGAAITAQALEARLLSLGQSTLPCSVTRPTSGEVMLDYTFPQGVARAHRITLRIDERTRIVRVREQAGASGDAPRTAAEADMRPVGTLGMDATRPRAKHVWLRAVQTTVIVPEQLTRVPLRLHAHSAEVTAPDAASLDPDALVHLVCALVTRSGFNWQPIFFWA